MPSRPGNYLLRTSADCSPYRPPALIRRGCYPEIIPAALQIAACAALPTRKVMLAPDLALSMRLFAIDTRRDVRAIELSELRRAEGSTSARSSRHRTELAMASGPGTDAPEWQSAFSGRPLSIFRVWFAVSSGCFLGDDPPGSPPGRALGRRLAYPLGNASALSQGI
jgi:hypothetical protein